MGTFKQNATLSLQETRCGKGSAGLYKVAHNKVITSKQIAYIPAEQLKFFWLLRLCVWNVALVPFESTQPSCECTNCKVPGQLLHVCAQCGVERFVTE
jgi:hypothetical protein